MIIFTKFRKDSTKIMDFFLLAKFWACLLFFPTLYVELLFLCHLSLLHIMNYAYLPSKVSVKLLDI